MNLTQEEKNNLYDIGYYGFGLNEIIKNFDFDKQEVIKQFELEEGEIYKNWFKGWLTSAIDLNKTIMDSAKNSSTPAQKQIEFIRIQTERKNKNILDYNE